MSQKNLHPRKTFAYKPLIKKYQEGYVWERTILVNQNIIQPVENFIEKVKLTKYSCDFCNKISMCKITNYGTTNYNRLICSDCEKEISQQEVKP